MIQCSVCAVNANSSVFKLLAIPLLFMYFSNISSKMVWCWARNSSSLMYKFTRSIMWKKEFSVSLLLVIAELALLRAEVAAQSDYVHCHLSSTRTEVLTGVVKHQQVALIE